MRNPFVPGSDLAGAYDLGLRHANQYPLIQNIEAEARRYAEMYQPNSDGRNTFTIFADWVAKLANSPAVRTTDPRPVER